MPLTPLGLEADRSFHLGSTSKAVYKAELEQFIQRAFPGWLQERAHASLELYLGDNTKALTLPEIPHKIYQTSKTEPRGDWKSSTWQNIPGYTYWFFDDELADKWVRDVFGGTEMEKVWDVFGPGIKRSDLLRYLLVMTEGGIYSDMDTVRLKDLDQWGHGAGRQGPESKGLPSVFVGIEADVGTRSDWHKWWPRPLQMVQWTFAAAPLHPILIDTVRRVHHVTAIIEAKKAKNETSNATDLKEHWVGGELLRNDGTVSIMEWTGPGVFTDSVIRYIAAEHNITWPALKNLRKPLRIRDTVVLPVTGFSPGVGMFGAGDTSNEQAMVQHLFAGSWKSTVMSKPYDPPEYNFAPPSPATQPVNFGDEPSSSNAYHGSKQSLGASTELSYPQSKFNSGISVEAQDPFVSGEGYKGGLNENGQTRAQALASEYRSSPINLSPRDGALSSASSQTFSSSEQSKDLLATRKSATSSQLDAMTYVDENYNVYRSPRMKNADQFNDNASLVEHAAAPAGASHRMADLEYAEPVTPSPGHPDNAKKSVMARLLGNDGARHPLEQRIQAKRAGVGRQRYPFVVWILSLAMLGVMIWELVRNKQEQGSAISLKPYVNPMLGPSSSGLINLGGRFVPCMKLVDEVPPSFNLGCFNNTANPPTELCSIETLCGFGEFHGSDPNQWFRFITPIFLHAGIIHFALNMFAQLTLSAQVEREMGSGAFLILYASAGIFGNVLGGNFALVGVPSVGASGAIFGTVAVMWVDLLAHWKLEYRPGRKLVMLCIDLIIGVALGFVPGVDNFAHLGGFLMGLLTAIVFYPVISTTKTHKAVMWFCRLAMIPVAVILFVVLIRNFYKSDPYAACQWCRYLSCIPASWNNRCQGTGITTTTTTT
ncbi:rhomboid family protein [Rhizoctonia solani 123E]|uniref:Rhomboid family protein n=1 Tax=Rhizoctonia solani 123E TaxID=1423351 RepID=A0A074S9V6_9AGAM|nr:rhomboid family protein [Rhizoctonia solani 123E]